ncbi:hypothetical protein NYE67_02685 [Solibacillus sp. FSL W8-0474]|uniref:hypothetical protein n=1 Tax=Solibacillus sp. FSL W8-0474 TaxID=2975336 RepID=UPI0030F5FF69
MYILSNSFVKPIYEYRVESYSMELLSHSAVAHIDLKIFGEEAVFEMYSADYEIERADGKNFEGSCMNRPTKEATLLAVEESVIDALENESYWV